ncbi:hypothetical protein AHF37_11827 [Paragonimus kellicotti]|nr:hypothetical protein AHF37_11827 [Paragonimus kellicotti]
MCSVIICSIHCLFFSDILGVFDSKIFLQLLTGSVTINDHVEKVVNKGIRKLSATVKPEDLSRHLLTEPYVLIQDHTDIWLVSQEDLIQWTIGNCA